MSTFSHVYKTYTLSDYYPFKMCSHQPFSNPNIAMKIIKISLKYWTNKKINMFLSQTPSFVPKCVCFLYLWKRWHFWMVPDTRSNIWCIIIVESSSSFQGNCELSYQCTNVIKLKFNHNYVITIFQFSWFYIYT